MVPHFDHLYYSKTTLLITLLCFIIVLVDVDHVRPNPVGVGYQRVHVYHYCYANQTPNSINDVFQNNVNLLLANISCKASELSFYNSTSTACLGDQTAYALYLCQGNVSQQTCHDCVASSAQFLTQTCVNHREGIVWSTECMLRYSDKNIFALGDHGAGTYYCSPENVTDVVQFNHKLSVLVEELFAKAAYGCEKPGFATGEAKISEFTTMYGLAQCTPDITGYECNQCLRSIMVLYDNKCNGKQWAMIFRPSCQVRFDPVPFY